MIRTLPAVFPVSLACLFVVGCCCKAPSSSPGGSSTPGSPPTSSQTAENVDLAKLLADYKANEVRADGQYKNKLVEFRGTVGDVKKDIVGNPYVILTPHGGMIFPSAQCTFSDGGQAAKLNKGDSIKVRGKIGGLMMNVQVRDCVVVG